MRNLSWSSLVWLLLIVAMASFLVAGVWTESQHALGDAQAKIIYLPNLPSDCACVLSIVNAKPGVSVSYVTKEGMPRMVQYTYTYENGECVFDRAYHFRFENER